MQQLILGQQLLYAVVAQVEGADVAQWLQQVGTQESGTRPGLGLVQQPAAQYDRLQRSGQSMSKISRHLPCP